MNLIPKDQSYVTHQNATIANNAFLNLTNVFNQNFSQLKRTSYKIFDKQNLFAAENFDASNGGNKLILYNSVVTHEISSEFDSFNSKKRYHRRGLEIIFVMSVLLIAATILVYIYYLQHLGVLFTDATDAITYFVFFLFLFAYLSSVALFFVVRNDKFSKLRIWHKGSKLFSKSLAIQSCLREYYDLTTDILTVIAYSNLSSSNSSQSQQLDINYNDLFAASIFILILSRVSMAIIIYFDFSHSLRDSFLQLFGLYPIWIAYVSYESHYKKKTSIQHWFELLQAASEAAPQLLIVSYVVVIEITYGQVPSLTFIISLLSSVVAIGNDIVAHDRQYFLTVTNLSDLDKRMLWFNPVKGFYKWLFKYLWRYFDVFAHYGFYAWIWIVGSGTLVLTLAATQLVIFFGLGLFVYDNLHVVSCIYCFLPHGRGYNGFTMERFCNAVWCAICILFGMIAMFISDTGISSQFPTGIIIFVGCCFVISIVCNLFISSFHMGATVASRTSVGCNNMDDLYETLDFGYKIPLKQFNIDKTWINFEEPLELYCFMMNNKELIKNSKYKWDDKTLEYDEIWAWILKNPILSAHCTLYWKLLLTQFSKKDDTLQHDIYDCSECLGTMYLFLEICEIQTNDQLIAMLIKTFDIQLDLDFYGKHVKYNYKIDSCIKEYLQYAILSSITPMHILSNMWH